MYLFQTCSESDIFRNNGAAVTPEEVSQSLAEWQVYQKWFDETILKEDPVSGSTAVLILPCAAWPGSRCSAVSSACSPSWPPAAPCLLCWRTCTGPMLHQGPGHLPVPDAAPGTGRPDRQLPDRRPAAASPAPAGGGGAAPAAQCHRGRPCPAGSLGPGRAPGRRGPRPHRRHRAERHRRPRRGQRLLRRGTARRLGQRRSREHSLPGGLAALLLSRVEQLSDAAQQVLRAAAVARRKADDELVRAASGLAAADYEAAVREAVTDQLLVADGSEGYVFRHALLREAVYADLLPGERTRLHATMSSLLADEQRFAVPGTAAELAQHCLASHDIPGAFAASIRAGEEAERLGAPAEAHRHYDQALALWDRVSEPDR